MAEVPTHPVRFGGFVFDPVTGELHSASDDGGVSTAPGGARSGALRVLPTRLPPKPARLLALLLHRPGELVPREVLADELWPDQHLDVDGGLAYTVRQVRLALGDDASDPRFIETLPRRGYRFVGQVDGGGVGSETDPADGKGAVDSAGTGPPGGANPVETPVEGSADMSAKPPAGRSHRAWAAGLTALLAAFLALLLLSRLEGTATPPTRVALLPLSPPERLAGDPGARAANRRLEQALLVALSEEAGLEVVGPATTSRTAAAGGTPAEMGTALDVPFTVSGGLATDEGILFLQVIRTADGGHVFARRYAGDEAALRRHLPSIATDLARACRR